MGILATFLRSHGVKGPTSDTPSCKSQGKQRRNSRTGNRKGKASKTKRVVVDEQEDEVDFTCSSTFETDSMSADSIIDDDESIQSKGSSRASQVKEGVTKSEGGEQVVVLEGALPLSMLDVISPGWNTPRSDPPRPPLPHPRLRYQLAFKENRKYATECEITEWKWEKQIVCDRRNAIESKRKEDRAKRLQARATDTSFERDFLPYDNVNSRKMLQSAFPEDEEDLSDCEECSQQGDRRQGCQYGDFYFS